MSPPTRFRMSGIYAIKHESGKLYIGSASNFHARWMIHRCYLNKGNHHNRHLQFAWNKYGSAAFEFVVLEYCDENVLLEREQAYFDALKPFGKNGYNVCQVAGSCYGVKRKPVTKETRQRISDGLKGKPLSPEHRAKLSVIRVGRKVSEQQKQKMRAWALANRDRMSAAANKRWGHA